MWEFSTITDAGANLLASWISGTALQITRAAAGTGTVADADLYASTALANQKQAMSIVSMTRGDKSITVKLQLEAETEGYMLQQIGIYAKVGDGSEVLFAIFQDNVGISVPSASTSQSFVYNFVATLAVSNTGTLTVNIDGSASVTLELLQELLGNKQDKITATGLLYRDADGTIREAIPGEDFEAGSGGGGFYGSSDTAADTTAKTVAAEGYDSLEVGDLCVVKFANANTVAGPTLKVGDTDAKKIVSRGKSSLLPADFWAAGAYCQFIYDGENWVLLFTYDSFVPTASKGANGGVATLDSDGKVVASQLRGGFVVSSTQPADTSLLWIDGKQTMRYYDQTSGAWLTVLPVWG